ILNGTLVTNNITLNPLDIVVKNNIIYFNNETELNQEKARIDSIFNGDKNDDKKLELGKNFSGSDLTIENISNITITVEITNGVIRGLTYKLIGINNYAIGASNKGITKTNWIPTIVEGINALSGSSYTYISDPQEIESIRRGVLPMRIIEYLYNGTKVEMDKIVHLNIKIFTDSGILKPNDNFGSGFWRIQITDSPKYKLANGQLISSRMLYV
ncbi:MAG: hypothetical protein KFW07_02630, partial [Mycoplasmataceae bacterium]|nr:hypothetical protein [Mycoplasmataceae bacterium]